MSEMNDKKSVAIDENIEVNVANTQERKKTIREELGYIIDPEFKNLIGRTDEEYARLKEAIRRDGKIRDAFVGWEEERILVDGHGRADIYDEFQEELGDEFNIEPPRIVWMSFINRDEAKMWIFKNQDARRNWNAFRRIVAALQFKPYYAEQAKTNQHAGVSQNLGKGIEANEEVAKLAKSSAETVRKVEKILEQAGKAKVKKAINALRKDEKGFSIDSVYKQYCVKKREEQSSSIPDIKTNSKSVSGQSGGNPSEGTSQGSVSPIASTQGTKVEQTQPVFDPVHDNVALSEFGDDSHSEQVEGMPVDSISDTDSALTQPAQSGGVDNAVPDCAALFTFDKEKEPESSVEGSGGQSPSYVDKFSEDVAVFKLTIKRRPNDLSQEDGTTFYKEFRKLMEWLGKEYSDAKKMYDTGSKS